MKIEEIKVDDSYTIIVNCDDGVYSARGYRNGKPVTVPIVKSVLLGFRDIDGCPNTVKTIENCGIENCKALEDAYQAIVKQMPQDPQLGYKDLVDVVKGILKQRFNLFFFDTVI